MDALGDAQLLRLIAQGGLIRAFPGQRQMRLRDLRQSRKRQRLTLDGDQRAGVTKSGAPSGRAISLNEARACARGVTLKRCGPARCNGR
jgi:hypothetical protein